MFACSVYPLDRRGVPRQRSRPRSASRSAGCATGPAWRCGAATTRWSGAGRSGAGTRPENAELKADATCGSSPARCRNGSRPRTAPLPTGRVRRRRDGRWRSRSVAAAATSTSGSCGTASRRSAAYGHEAYRFVSEFGFESLPALATVAAFAPDPADWNLGSPLLDHHQRCPDGNARILGYMAQQFRLPHDFEGIVYLSQVLHAEAMRVGVEHWRRAAGPLQRRALLAAQRLLAGFIVVEHRLLRPLEGAPVRLAAVLRPGAADGRGREARATPSRSRSSTTGPRPGAARSAGRWSGSTGGGRGRERASWRRTALATTAVVTVPVAASPRSGDARARVRAAGGRGEAGSRRHAVRARQAARHWREPKIELALAPAGPGSVLAAPASRTRWRVGSSFRSTARTWSSATTTSTCRPGREGHDRLRGARRLGSGANPPRLARPVGGRHLRAGSAAAAGFARSDLDGHVRAVAPLFPRTRRSCGRRSGRPIRQDEPDQRGPNAALAVGRPQLSRVHAGSSEGGQGFRRRAGAGRRGR